jgi:hypothetical protein
MTAYVGQTRSRALIARLSALGRGEFVARGELPARRARSRTIITAYAAVHSNHQRRDQPVRCSEASRAQTEKSGGFDDLGLHGQVSLQIDLGGRLVGVSEPVRHLAQVPGCPERRMASSARIRILRPDSATQPIFVSVRNTSQSRGPAHASTLYDRDPRHRGPADPGRAASLRCSPPASAT